jgi:hypothetical protein
LRGHVILDELHAGIRCPGAGQFRAIFDDEKLRGRLVNRRPLHVVEQPQHNSGGEPQKQPWPAAENANEKIGGRGVDRGWRGERNR